MDIMNDLSCSCYNEKLGNLNKVRAIIVKKPLVFVVVALIVGLGIGSMN